MVTVKEAKDTTIFTIVNGEVVKNNLYDFVMESVDETTSPRGVEPRIHVRPDEDAGTFEVWTWGVRGNNPVYLMSFNTKEEAEDWVFERVFEFDFLEDDQRDISYFDTPEEAQALINERNI